MYDKRSRASQVSLAVADTRLVDISGPHIKDVRMRQALQDCHSGGA